MMVDQPVERSVRFRPGLIAAAVFLCVYGTLALAVDFPRAAQGFKSDEATYYMMAYSLIEDADLPTPRTISSGSGASFRAGRRASS